MMARLAATVAIMIVGLPLIAAASSPAVGTAQTSITLLGLSYKSSNAGVTHTINVAVSSGIATTDPVRNNLTALKASASVLAAQVAGVTDTVERFGDWAVSAESGSTDTQKNSTTTADNQEQINESVVKGDVTATALFAEVDPTVPSAKATAAGLNLDLVVGDGDLIALDDVRASILDDSNPTSAKADQSVSVSRISIVPLRELLDRVGGLSPDALLALADKWGNATTRAQVAAATAAAAPLLAVVPTTTSVASAIAAVTASCALVPIAPVCAALATLQTELDTLIAMFSATGIVDITNLTAGVTAEAFDNRATASALAGYESIFVLGREVTQTATLNEAFIQLEADLNEMKDDFSAMVSALSGLTIEIDTIFPEEKIGTDGSYQTSSASVSVLRFLLRLPATTGSSSGFSAQATAGDPLTVDARVLTLAGKAEHRPSIVDLPGGGSGAPGGPTANTGPEETVLLSGLLLMVVGLRVRRWLGDAA